MSDKLILLPFKGLENKVYLFTLLMNKILP